MHCHYFPPTFLSKTVAKCYYVWYNVYTPNEVEVKLFMDQITFEVRKSITNDQIKNAFTNATQLGNFVSMQFGYVQNRLELDLLDSAESSYKITLYEKSEEEAKKK